MPTPGVSAGGNHMLPWQRRRSGKISARSFIALFPPARLLISQGPALPGSPAGVLVSRKTGLVPLTLRVLHPHPCQPQTAHTLSGSSSSPRPQPTHGHLLPPPTQAFPAGSSPSTRGGSVRATSVSPGFQKRRGAVVRAGQGGGASAGVVCGRVGPVCLWVSGMVTVGCPCGGGSVSVCGGMSVLVSDCGNAVRVCARGRACGCG